MTTTLFNSQTEIAASMVAESLNVRGAKLLPLFYTTSGDPDIWNLTLDAREVSK